MKNKALATIVSQRQGIGYVLGHCILPILKKMGNEFDSEEVAQKVCIKIYDNINQSEATRCLIVRYIEL